MRFSLGYYHPYQKYFLASLYSSRDKKKIAGFLNHSTTFALQAALGEDARKKNMLYPQIDWKVAASLMSVPRYISRFETDEYKFGNFTFDAFLKQQFDVFFIANSFAQSDSQNENTHFHFSWSGDANLSFSNGFNIEYNTKNRSFHSLAGVQARSSLLVNDIRLFSPNPLVLIPNLKIITPAINVVGNSCYTFKRNANLSFDAIFEFTNMSAVIFSGSVTGKCVISEKMNLGISFGRTDQLKGIEYFWYPAQRRWVDIILNYSVNSLSVSLLEMPLSGITVNVSFKREIVRATSY